MKKIALVAALAAISASAFAQSSVTLYGRMNTTVESQKVGDGDRKTVLQNNSSRIGLRGQEDLGAGLSASFYLDGTLLADTGAMGASGPFWDRRSTVSLASRQWGELRLGRDWVPTHLVRSGFDPFATLGIGSANGFRSFTASRALGQAFEVLRAELARDGIGLLMVYPSFLDTPIDRNALGADGRPAGHARSTIGRIRGADWMAGEILKGLEQRRERLFPDRGSWLASLLWRLAPALYYRQMSRRFAAEMG